MYALTEEAARNTARFIDRVPACFDARFIVLLARATLSRIQVRAQMPYSAAKLPIGFTANARRAIEFTHSPAGIAMVTHRDGHREQVLGNAGVAPARAATREEHVRMNQR